MAHLFLQRTHLQRSTTFGWTARACLPLLAIFSGGLHALDLPGKPLPAPQLFAIQPVFQDLHSFRFADFRLSSFDPQTTLSFDNGIYGVLDNSHRFIIDFARNNVLSESGARPAGWVLPKGMRVIDGKFVMPGAKTLSVKEAQTIMGIMMAAHKANPKENTMPKLSGFLKSAYGTDWGLLQPEPVKVPKPLVGMWGAYGPTYGQRIHLDRNKFEYAQYVSATSRPYETIKGIAGFHYKKYFITPGGKDVFAKEFNPYTGNLRLKAVDGAERREALIGARKESTFAVETKLLPMNVGWFQQQAQQFQNYLGTVYSSHTTSLRGTIIGVTVRERPDQPGNPTTISLSARFFGIEGGLSNTMVLTVGHQALAGAILGIDVGTNFSVDLRTGAMELRGNAAAGLVVGVDAAGGGVTRGITVHFPLGTVEEWGRVFQDLRRMLPTRPRVNN